MNNELLLLIKKHTDTLIEQTKTRPQETLEYKMKMNRQMQNFLFNTPIILVKNGRRLLAVTSFEVTNSVFSITDETDSFSITIPGHWQTKSAEKTIDELNKLLELTPLELHIKEVRKRGKEIKIGDNDYEISDFDTQKKMR